VESKALKDDFVDKRNNIISQDLPTVQDIGMWSKYRGGWCTGCKRDKLVEHNRVASTQQLVYHAIRACGVQDIFYIEKAT
jgi:hypothetical protein